MKFHKKHEDIFVNIITPPDGVKATTDQPAGNAGKDPFCVYAGMRHAVGSVIINEDGSKTVCTEDGSWQNT
ncbi:hypothetical protein SAMN02745975_01043 [Geosporobacter subterraneus DSM 17957]|uniref:Uncharacterized protein n=1 Tax=Geosporobacter subterraneus DSM 17957 TaxID=1121919 RepID=A0A1M6FPN0_9FIRM|nr:hypothetical protein [Geosporobacter subterraneus]SHI99626.1 hypothetical protein SAMN02745975_01043 [Geosporobacter subterraneus DSM 17957]